MEDQSRRHDILDGSSGSVIGLKENGFVLKSVPDNASGESLPYVSIDWPNPGDLEGAFQISLGEKNHCRSQRSTWLEYYLLQMSETELENPIKQVTNGVEGKENYGLSKSTFVEENKNGDGDVVKEKPNLSENTIRNVDGKLELFVNGELIVQWPKVENIMANEKLVEIASADPKRAKWILANWQSAARSKERNMRYIS
ncbi:hypothetical protein IFM89_009045 [Coptis chinensis]|uniref:Uncharacterized protein n=1 Tax=Coptis chinensis TaxID=261450 RepID=A0A835IVC3_9MAGN|nr:hypothetical protein IFM89_009045 [Coptis chinensis]